MMILLNTILQVTLVLEIVTRNNIYLESNVN